MIYIQAARKVYDDYFINELGWIRRELNISDSLTDISANAIMKEFMRTGKIFYTVEQYLVRTISITQFSTEKPSGANIINH